MPKSSRPRRKYTPRAVIKPLNMKNLVGLEMPGQVGLLALGKGWVDQSHIRDIGAHAALVERVAMATGSDEFAALARRVIAIAHNCEERFDRTGRPGVSGDEMLTLKEIVPKTMSWLREQSNHLIHRESLYLVHHFDKAVAEHADAA